MSCYFLSFQFVDYGKTTTDDYETTVDAYTCEFYNFLAAYNKTTDFINALEFVRVYNFFFNLQIKAKWLKTVTPKYWVMKQRVSLTLFCSM